MSEQILTEQSNPASTDIDLLSGRQIVELINREDQKVAIAVAAETENIGRAVELIAAAFQKGGRLGYFGAGTSGRIGILDASSSADFRHRPGTGSGIYRRAAAEPSGKQSKTPKTTPILPGRILPPFLRQPRTLSSAFLPAATHAISMPFWNRPVAGECKPSPLPPIPAPLSGNMPIFSSAPGSRPGSDCRIVPAEIWHRPENDIKHAHHRRHDSLRKNLQKLYD